MTTGVHVWSRTASSNGSADTSINFAEGQPPSSVNDSARAVMARVAEYRDDNAGSLTTGGTPTAYTITTNSSFASLAELNGQRLSVRFNAANGSAATLNVNGKGAKAIQIASGIAAPAGMFAADSVFALTYDNSIPAFLVNGQTSALPVTSLDIVGGTALTSPAVDDSFAIYDLSATAGRKITLSDTLKVISGLTADSSPDASADYTLTYDNSASAAKKVLLRDLPGRLPRGYIDGCILSNGTDATNDIDISAGVCRDSTNSIDITLAALTGKQLDANWAAGSNAGMRNSAAGIANSTYHLWAVAPASGVGDIYAHTSADAATVLTALQAETGGGSYLYVRIIGSIIRTGSSILAFTQKGDQFIWSGAGFDVSVSNPGTSAVLRTLSVPIGVSVEAKINAYGTAGSTSFLCYISSPYASDEVPSTSGAALASLAGAATDPRQLTVRTNTSGQVRTRLSSSGASDILRISTLGFVHPRGKDS